jgi:hypothetical protein
MTMLGMPDMPQPKTVHSSTGPVTFTSGHHFTHAADIDPAQLAETTTAPLSVILQVTKRCDFDCTFCSVIRRMRSGLTPAGVEPCGSAIRVPCCCVPPNLTRSQ